MKFGGRSACTTPPVIRSPSPSKIWCWTAASRYGFAIEQTTLAYSAPGDTGLQRLDVEIPLSGPYALLRNALVDLSNEPAVRIERVTLERKDISSGMLDINLKVSVLGVVE